MSATLGTGTALTQQAESDVGRGRKVPFDKDFLYSGLRVKCLIDILGTEKEHLIPGRLRGPRKVWD